MRDDEIIRNSRLHQIRCEERRQLERLEREAQPDFETINAEGLPRAERPRRPILSIRS